jgi:hypothetical protein
MARKKSITYIYTKEDGDGRCEISFTIPNGQSCFVDFWFDFKDKDTMTSTEGDKQSNDFIAFLKNAGCTKIELK